MFTVHWLPNALNKLAEVWLKASDKDAVTQAVHRLDMRLQHDPRGQSESRDGLDRILLEPPLGVFFRIDATGQAVYVQTVWSFDKR